MRRVHGKPTCAVLFDGAGLARLGLERAGWECIGVELDPVAHYLSTFVGSGRCVLGDATKQDLTGFDAVWASPPCQQRTTCIKDLTGQGGLRRMEFAQDYLLWSLTIPNIPILWVENVTIQGSKGNDWGTVYNAAQFVDPPVQNRNRIIGGRYVPPRVLAPYRRSFPGICPTITATEYKASGATDKCRASRFYKRNLTIDECAYHMGFEVPKQWLTPPSWFAESPSKWRYRLYNAVGNGVFVPQAEAFGVASL